MPDILKIFSTNIKKIRQNLGYTQRKFSELINLSTGYIAEIELGRKFPSVHVLQQLIDLLKIEPYELFISDSTNIEKIRNTILINKIKKELKEKLNSDIDNVFMKNT
jgi:transcriptional regulator with XRE-family HTH domain